MQRNIACLFCSQKRHTKNKILITNATKRKSHDEILRLVALNSMTRDICIHVTRDFISSGSHRSSINTQHSSNITESFATIDESSFVYFKTLVRSSLSFLTPRQSQ